MIGHDLDLIKAHVEEVQSQYPNFELALLECGTPEASGTISFDVEHEGERFADHFSIRVRFPIDYARTFPFVWETGGRVPESFGHFMQGGNLCLGAPVELQERFSSHGTLLQFLNDQVVSYLFGFVYHRRHGKMPFGELTHGYLGLLFYYCERFSETIVPTLKLLKCLADNDMPSKAKCACGKGAVLEDCHGPALTRLLQQRPPERFEKELRGMLKALHDPEISDLLAKNNVKVPRRLVTPKRLLRNQDRRLRR